MKVRLKKALSLLLALVMCLGCMSLPAFANVKEQGPDSVTDTKNNVTYSGLYKVSEGFYQDGAKYDSTSNFYITSIDGLKYFRDLISACDGGTIAGEYAQEYKGQTAIDFYQSNIFTAKTVHLLADIDLDNVSWTPIGYVNTAFNNGSSKTYFYGNFNGHNHTIRNLKVESSETNYFYSSTPYKCESRYGLFGSLGGTIKDGQTFQDLTIENVNIDTTGDTRNIAIGALIGNAASNYTLINNCHLSGAIVLKGTQYVGGLLGIGATSIQNCTVEGNKSSIICGGSSGGLAGADPRADNNNVIENCTVSHVNVEGTKVEALVGALVGMASAKVTVKDNSANYVKVNDSYATESTLLGYASAGSSFEDNTVSPTAVAQIGGTKYTSLMEAINAAYNGGTVELLQDVTVNRWHQNVWSTEDRTDLTYSGNRAVTGCNGLTINGNGKTLTVNSVDSGNNGNQLFYGSKNLTVKNLTIDAASGVNGIGLKSGVIENVTFNMAGTNPAIYTSGSEGNAANEHIEIRNCTFNTDAADSYAIYSCDPKNGVDSGTIISGNTFNTRRSIALRSDMQFRNNVVNGEKGVTVAGGSTAVVQGNYFAKTTTNRSINVYPSTAVIKDNVILGPIELENETYEVFPDLSENFWGGGAPANLPEGVICNSYYTVANNLPAKDSVGANFTLDVLKTVVGSETYVAQSGNAKYETLAEAVAAVNAGDDTAKTITILADIDFSKETYAGYKWFGSTYIPLEITANNVTLDLNGHTFSNMGNCALAFGHIHAADGRIANGTIRNGTLLAGKTDNVTNSYVLAIAGVDGMTIKDITTTGGINVFTGSKDVVIDSCDVTGTKYYTVCAQSGSDVTIRGTTYTKNTDNTVANKSMFWIQGADTDSDCVTSGNPTGAFDASSITIESGTFTVDFENGGVFKLGTGLAPVVKGGTFNFDPTEYLAYGYTATNNGNGTWTVGKAVAQIGSANYVSLEAAFAAAQDGQTITLLADCAGNGIKAPQGKFTTGLTVDFAGFTYTVDGATVGSSGTETNGFQLLKENTITFKNGTITSAKAKILIQNYSNLTLEGMTLTLNNPNYASAYTLSNNNGNVVIDGSTINANPAGDFAFDVCRYASYPSVNVTVKGNSTINGDVEVSASKSDAKNGFSLTLEGGTLNGNIVLDASAAAAMEATPEKATVTKADTFEQVAPAGYKWVDNGNGTSSLVEIVVAQIGTTKYATLQAAFEAAENGQTITLLADIDLSGYARSASVDFKLPDNATLDLNGKTIKGFNSGVRYGGTNVTIKNGTFGFVDAEAKPNYGLSIGLYKAMTHSTLTLEGITVIGGVNIDYADVTLRDVTINMTDATFYAIWVDEDGASATFESGTINTSTKATATFGVAPGTDVAKDGVITVTGGNVNFDSVMPQRLGGKYLPPVFKGGVYNIEPNEENIAAGYEAKKLGDTDKYVVGLKDLTTTVDTGEGDAVQVVTDTAATSKTNEQDEKVAEKTVTTKTFDKKTGEELTSKPTVITAEATTGGYKATVTPKDEKGEAIANADFEVTSTVKTASSTETEQSTNVVEQIQGVLGENKSYLPTTNTDESVTNAVEMEEIVAELTGSLVIEGSAEENTSVDVRISVKPTLKSVTKEENTVVLGFDFTPYATAYENANPDAVALTAPMKIDNARIKKGETITFTVNVPKELQGKVETVFVKHNDKKLTGDGTSYSLSADGKTVTITTDSFSPYDVELNTIVVETANALVGANLTLGGAIGLNFHIKAIANAEKVRFTRYHGDTLEVITQDITGDKNGDTESSYTVNVAAKDIRKPITIEILDASGNPMTMKYSGTGDVVPNRAFSYSVADYIDKVQGYTYEGYHAVDSSISNAKFTANQNVANALERYGDFAHDYLLPGETATATGHEVNMGNDNAISVFSTGRKTTGTYPASIKSPGMNLLLRSETVVTNQFSTSSNYSGYTFWYSHSYSYEGNYTANVPYEVEVVNTNGVLYANSKGIPAKDLDKLVTLTIKNGNSTVYSITYSPMVYASSKIGSTSASTTLKNMVRAMYEYNRAAIDLSTAN